MALQRRRRREQFGTVVLTALIVGGIAIPATAEPPPGSSITAVPDGGARPATFGELPLVPTGTYAQPPAQVGPTPLAAMQAQRNAVQIEAAVLAERVNELKIEHDRARLELAWAQHAWTLSDESLKTAKEAAALYATEAYKSVRELPPQFQSGSLIRDLDLLQPRAKTFSESTAYELDRAILAEREAAQRLATATSGEKLAKESLDITITSFQQRDAAYVLLDQRVKALEADAERNREADANKLQPNYDPNMTNEGYRAAAGAQAAVKFALSQLGKPYRFAEEGPNYYDCSGLVQTAYKPSLLLPRVSRDMFRGTQQIPIKALLPGDLIYYARDNGDPRTIYHVAMYLGDNKVVHATSTGDVVKISKLNFGPGGPVDYATRVIPAVKVDTSS